MRPSIQRACTAAVGVGAVLTLVGGAVTVASASGSSTKIHACETKHTHVLHLGSCHSGEKKITWNQRGPAGKKGATGPSDVYVYSYNANGGGTAVPINGTASGTLLTVPAGEYLVSYSIGIYNHDVAASDYYGCQPSYATGSHSFFGGFVDLGTAGGTGYDPGGGTLVEPLSVTAPTTIAITCSDFGAGGGGTLENFSVTATRTAHLHVTGFKPATTAVTPQSRINESR